MYLIDTNVVSEMRKMEKANPGVRAFFCGLQDDQVPLYVSAITIGELRRGVEKIRHRGDIRIFRWTRLCLGASMGAVLSVKGRVPMLPREWLDGYGFLQVVHSLTMFCSQQPLRATQALQPAFG